MLGSWGHLSLEADCSQRAELLPQSEDPPGARLRAWPSLGAPGGSSGPESLSKQLTFPSSLPDEQLGVPRQKGLSK